MLNSGNKKILMFNSGSMLYGSERGLINAVKALKGEYSIIVVLPGYGPLVPVLRRHKADIIFFPVGVISCSFSPVYFIGFFLSFLAGLLFFCAYAAAKRIDIIYSNNSLIIMPSFLAMILRKRHVWHMREFFGISAVNKMIVYLSSITSSKVICQSMNIRDVLFRGKDKGISVVYEGIDVDDFSRRVEDKNAPKMPVLGSAVVLGVVSRIHPSKGQYEFLKMMKDISGELKRDGIILIVGDLSLVNIRNCIYKLKLLHFIRKHKLQGRVFLTGFRADMAEVFGIIDICVFPFRRNEPFGLAVLESLAFSCETLVNFSPGISEITAFYPGMWMRLSKDKLKERINGYKGKKRGVFLPEVFTFSSYRKRMTEFFLNL